MKMVSIFIYSSSVFTRYNLDVFSDSKNRKNIGKKIFCHISNVDKIYVKMLVWTKIIIFSCLVVIVTIADSDNMVYRLL